MMKSKYVIYFIMLVLANCGQGSSGLILKMTDGTQQTIELKDISASQTVGTVNINISSTNQFGGYILLFLKGDNASSFHIDGDNNYWGTCGSGGVECSGISVDSTERRITFTDAELSYIPMTDAVIPGGSAGEPITARVYGTIYYPTPQQVAPDHVF